MKTKLTIYILVILMFNSTYVFSQEVTYNWLNSKKSYNNTSVTVGALTSEDYNITEKQTIRNQLESSYNGLTFKAEATAKYNCHYFAWFQSEQYPGTEYWLNIPDKNWYDYSYIQVPSETFPGKVTYSDSEDTLQHTANTTKIFQRYDSKWGSACRFEHDYDECPYWRQGDRALKYYKKLDILGKYSIECESTIYQIPNSTGMNYSVSWSTSNNNLQLLNQNNYTCNVSSLSSGSSSIIASIYRPGYNETFNKTKDVSVRVDPPEDISYLQFYGNLCSNSINYFYTDYAHPEYVYRWTVSGNGSIVEGEGTPYIGVQCGMSGNLYVELTIENGCGMNNSYGNWYFIPTCYDEMIQLSPNPAEDMITIKLSTEPEANSTIEICNFKSVKLLSIPLLSQEQTVDVSSLPPGLNIVRIVSKSGFKTAKFLKK